MDFDKIDEGHPDYAPGEEPLHFFYNRENRIARAPHIVQEYYAGRGPRPVKGLFRVLVSTRGNRFMLSSIVVFAAFLWIFSFFSGRNAFQIAGAKASLSAFSYEETVYATFSMKGADAESAEKDSASFLQIPVSAVFTAIESSGSECAREERSGVYTGEELFIRTKFTDYDIIKVCCEVTAASETKQFESVVAR